MSWTFIYIIDALAILSFVLSYYFTCYRQGYRFDIWHSQLFLICVMPNMLMLPFSKSELNYPILGKDFYAVVEVLPVVFLINMLGYIAVLIGGFVWRIRVGLGLRNLMVNFLDVIPRCSLMMMSSRSVLLFQGILCCLLQVGILTLYFLHNGFGFDLREYTFANPALRPVALFISGYSIMIGSHCLARYVDKKEKVLLGCTLFLTFGLVFFGARGNILGIYISVLFCYLVKLKSKVSLLRIFIAVSFIIVIGLYLGNVRAGDYSISNFFSALAIILLYGNTFSDLRDFSWVYALWDHKLWLGKTYLAALMAFVPRFASEFRDTWGLGVATATTLGLDPHVHPGVRPGFFGEGFFNFNLVGVTVIGLILGLMLRYTDMGVKQSFASHNPSMMKAFSFTTLLGVMTAIALSAGFSGLYVVAGLYFFSWLLLQAQKYFSSKNLV